MKRDLAEPEQTTPTKKLAAETETPAPVESRLNEATKQESSKIEPKEEESKDSNQEADPSAAEGSTSTTKKPESTTTTAPSTSSMLKPGNPLFSGAFGKSSAFSSSFGTSAFGSSFSSLTSSSIKPKDNPWTEAKPKSSSQETETTSATEQVAEEAETKSADQYAVVSLEKHETKTGEEEEETIFQARGKLYAMNLKDTVSGWKERGVGMFHLNFSEGRKMHRALMRADTLHKVILNVQIAQHTDLHKGFQSSGQSAKFVRLSGAESDGSLYQYALRLQTADLATELFEHLEAAKN